VGHDIGATLQEEALYRTPEEEIMSNITLSAAVRSNLLSLQNTASLLDTTQTRLATGNKVNSALDNPTSYFTAASLNARASDLGNLLDSVSNAVQTIQAANDGITSITKLVESAQSTANQAQQLSATVTTTVAATSASVAGGSFTPVDFTNGGSNDGSISFDLTLDGTTHSISVGFADVSAAVDKTAVTAAELTTALNTKIAAQFGAGTYAAVNGTSGGIDISSITTGTSSAVTIANFTAANGASGSGLADHAIVNGAAASTSTAANPARGALISQYNGLLDQIDQLTADAGFNGNNLLAGTATQLKVVFNESGTSSLTIGGKDTSATGLGLAQLTAGTEFDTNASITTILGKLKTAQDTLRADSSSFGSQLSIVQTRQDFTKALINTLQTGASNLTLADSNEEAANLLALQTRQSLSTKALSLASQGDQNVLRLLQ
jgi:flagellin-like hook-associated protein FlgL